MTDDQPTYAGLMHAGAGSGLALLQLAAVIPGFLPAVALTAVLVALVVVPLLAVGVVLAVLAGPPAAAWWLWRRASA
jgi:hypothetical protein